MIIIPDADIPATLHAPLPQPSPADLRWSLNWARPGKMRPAILLWAIGVPIPLVLLFVLIRGCAA